MADAINNKPPPLDWQTPIVNPQTGMPTNQFIRIWQLNFQNTEANNTGVNEKANADTVLTAGVGLDGGGDLSEDRTFDLSNTAVTPGTYGDTTHFVSLTVDAQGRITSITSHVLPILTDAPSDGLLYGRKNGAWVVVP